MSDDILKLTMSVTWDYPFRIIFPGFFRRCRTALAIIMNGNYLIIPFDNDNLKPFKDKLVVANLFIQEA